MEERRIAGEISTSEVGQGDVGGRAAGRRRTACSRATSQDRSPRRRSASQGGAARCCSRATSQGQVAQGRASQGSSLLSRAGSDTMSKWRRGEEEDDREVRQKTDNTTARV